MATPIPSNRARVTAWSVAAATGGRVIRVVGEGHVAEGITSDSRAVGPGNAFVALKGEQVDGHRFVEKAVAAGAVLLVVQRGYTVPSSLENVDVVEVDDTLNAWGNLGRAHLRAVRRRSAATPLRVVGITGSAGKTTTKEITAALLRTQGETLATAGNLNNRIGVPSMLFCLEPHHRFAVLELGMSLPGEIATLAAMVEADAAIITNVGLAHAEGVGGTRGDVAREKGALFEALGPEGLPVANADDGAVLGQLARSISRQARTYGRAVDADYRLLSRRTLPGESGASEIVVQPPTGEPLTVSLPLSGEAAALDFVAALAAAEFVAGSPFSSAQIQEALAHLKPPSGRGNRLALARGITVVDDSYNANPTSVVAALATASELARPPRRLVAVLGEMKELGAVALEEHRALGSALQTASVALFVGCGGLAAVTGEAARSLGIRSFNAENAAAAAEWLLNEVRDGDVILVKASRSVGAEVVVETLARALGTEPKGSIA